MIVDNYAVNFNNSAKKILVAVYYYNDGDVPVSLYTANIAYKLSFIGSIRVRDQLCSVGVKYIKQMTLGGGLSQE